MRPVKKYSVLVVDDNEEIVEILYETLSQDYAVFKAENAVEGLAVLSKEKIDLIITDQRMPSMSGIDFLEKTLGYNPGIIKILLTGYTDTEDLIKAINKGHIYKFITKPFKPQELKLIVRRALEHYTMTKENERLYNELHNAHEQLKENFLQLQKEITNREIFDKIIGTSPAIQNIFNDIKRISNSDITVLVTGETGTGKELVARAIHKASPRREGKFIVQDCASIPDTLLESELFGHKKGSFTGAVSDKRGLLEIADRGTIFMDEIGETSPAMQVRLLRFLQEGEIRAVGSETVKKVNVRLISATHRNLIDEIKKGNFRSDLYYRISTFPIVIPPLRLRREDIPLLAAHFLSGYNKKNRNANKRLSREAINLLLMYSYPGNIRELQNEIERAATMADNSNLILPEHLSDRMKESQVNPLSADRPVYQGQRKLTDMVEELERNAIQTSLKRHNGNKTKASSELGLSRLGLRKKILRYGMENSTGTGCFSKRLALSKIE